MSEIARKPGALTARETHDEAWSTRAAAGGSPAQARQP